MLIKSISVKNFRCAEKGKLNCGPLTAMVGANGTGKSTYLRALSVFYDLSPKLEKRDWYNEEQNNPIEITVTFTDLGQLGGCSRYGVYPKTPRSGMYPRSVTQLS
jgi:putative ATP-dependent endonuclease of the OLD family